MAGTVKLPVIGETKTAYVIGGVLIVGGIVGYAYLHNRSASASSASSGTTSAADAAAAATIDPQTGYPEGSPEDQQALAALGAGGDLYGSGGAYGYGYGDIPGIPTTSSNPNSGPGTFTDNAYWLAYAEENIIGYSPSQIQTALVAGLSGAKLTEEQFTIWQTALSVAGPPPSPPSSAPGPPGPGGKISGKVSGLSAHAEATSIRIAWHAVSGATGYHVALLQGGKQHEAEDVSTTSATISGLARKAHYEIRVRAQPGSEYSTVYATTT